MRHSTYAIAANLLLLTSALDANTVNPGQTVAPDVFTVTSQPPILGDLNGTFNIANGAVTGKWEEVALVDPLGIACTGCLDFAFQITNDPTSLYPIFAANLLSFFGYSTDAGYVHFTDPSIGPNGDTLPISVTRGPAGGTVGFSFATVEAVIGPGMSSPFLVVGTNATSYDTQGALTVAAFNFNTQGNISTQVTGVFEPTLQATPEPSMALVVGLGLAGLVALRLRTSGPRSR